MSDDNQQKWNRLSKLDFRSKNLTKRMRKVEGATVKHAHKFIIKRWSNILDVQQRVFIWVFTMGLLITSTGLQLMWYDQSYKTETPANNGTYAEAILGPIDTLNPIFAKTAAEQSINYLMFSKLLRYDETGHLNYDLVKDIKINDKQTIYKITIRSDAKWHDGTKLTTRDIDFTIGLLKNPDVRAVDIDNGWDKISTKIIDETTIEFTLSSTFAAFKHSLTFPILPEHILGKIAASKIRENSYSQNPIGSGPFKLSFVQNIDTESGRKIIHLARNNIYYGSKVKLSRFQMHIYESSEAIINALIKSEVNSAAGVSSADIERIDMKRYTVLSEPIHSGVYALINTKSELLQDVDIRQALRLATNTMAIRDKLPKNTPELYLPFIGGQLFGNDIPKKSEYDQSKASKLLDSKGWKLNGQNIRFKKKKELKITIITVKNSEFEQVLEILAGQWRSLGINVETQVIDPANTSKGDVQEILQPRDFDVLLYQLNIGADPDIYAYWHSSQAYPNPKGSNFSNYSSAISDDALTSARTRAESELRNAKYITFAKQWLIDVPAIGLYQPTTHYVTSRNTYTFNNSNIFISSIDRFSDVVNWSVGNQKVYKTP